LDAQAFTIDAVKHVQKPECTTIAGTVCHEVHEAVARQRFACKPWEGLDRASDAIKRDLRGQNP
jgi:hypothetical protein